jgi:hypothetical protein
MITRWRKEGSRKLPAISFVPAGDCELRPIEWLIKGMIEKDTLSVLFGDPEAGKSLVGIDMALCIAAGLSYHGMRVEQGAAFYAAGEGLQGLTRRMIAWCIRQQKNLKELPIYRSTMPALMCDSEGQKQILSALQATADHAGTPRLIVIDTLSRNFGPGNENAAEDMGKFVITADAIRAQHPGATVLVIHHSGHGDKSRGRGSSVLKAAADSEYKAEKDEDGAVRIESTKMKDAPPIDPMAFKIRPVELGIADEDGEPVSSVVLDQVEWTPRAETSCKPIKGKWQTAGMTALEGLCDNLPSGTTVREEDWRQECYKAGMNYNQFYRVKHSLFEAGRVNIEGGQITLQ